MMVMSNKRINTVDVEKTTILLRNVLPENLSMGQSYLMKDIGSTLMGMNLLKMKVKLRPNACL
jgi:hypothetical protein